MRYDNVAQAAVAGSTNPSQIIYAVQQVAASITAASTGTEAGTLKVQGSNDNPLGGASSGSAVVNWVDLSGVTVAITSGGGPYIIPKFDVCYQWLRVVYTHSAGAGNISFNVKTVGF